MIIEYSPFHRWYKEAIENPEELFGTKNRKRILSSLPRISEYSITHEIKPLDQSFLNWFTPKYSDTIGAKDNAVVHDIYTSTLGNKESKSVYWCLELKENNVPIGGTIFGIREDKITTAFKVYPYKWSHGTLQANPSLYTEYLMSKFAFEQGKDSISHGKDRNPYGINAAIGLAIFKLSTGYKPYLLVESEDCQSEKLNTDDIMTDSLLLHHPLTNTFDDPITKATLFTTKDTESKYVQVNSYPELLEVETVYLD